MQILKPLVLTHLDRKFMDSAFVLEKLKSQNVFLTGGGGVGKTHTAMEIISEQRRKKQSVVVLASTGIAAVNIGGQTVHSFFKFGVSNNLEELALWDKKNKNLPALYELLKKLDLLVIDEVSMLGAGLFGMIAFRLNRAGFSGRVLALGDFCQLPPVKAPVQTSLFDGGVYAFESLAWKEFDFAVIELEQIRRTKDAQFAGVLNKIRKARLDDEVLAYLFGLARNKPLSTREYTNLYGTNKEVSAFNRLKLEQINAPFARFGADVELSPHTPREAMLAWLKTLPIEQDLYVKVGASVLFTVNKAGEFYNGQQGVITGFVDENIVILSGGQEIILSRYEFVMSEYDFSASTPQEIELAFCRQFPIKVAFAITIHKSQGMGIENLICNIDNIFTPSQFYVALSRGISPQTLILRRALPITREYLRSIVRVNDAVLRFYEDLSAGAARS